MRFTVNFISYHTNKMKKRIAMYLWNVIELIQDWDKFYYTNSKGIKRELKVSEFTFIA